MISELQKRVLDMVNLDCLIIKLQLYSEEKLYSSTSLTQIIASHIEATSLADETYELIQEPDGDISKAQANFAELTEVPNQIWKSQSLLTL